MAYISALFAARMISQAGPRLDRANLFRGCGLDPSNPPDPAQMIPEADYYTLIETIAADEHPDIGFHIRVSRSMSCADFGAVGLAWKSAPDLRRSFRRMDRYARLYNSASEFELVDKGDCFWWAHRRAGSDRLGVHLSNEGALATYVSLCREATGAQNKPQSVQFRHRPCGSQTALEAHFRCPISFGAEVDALVIPAERLDRPNLVGDHSIWQFLVSQVEGALPAAKSEPAFQRQLVLKIADMLSDGVPPLSQVARSLGMSARTLQRRLASEGVTYQNLIGQARLELAKSLMADTEYSLAEIAFLTGFSEQSAFTRAFKRWAGRTPSAFREGARH